MSVAVAGQESQPYPVGKTMKIDRDGVHTMNTPLAFMPLHEDLKSPNTMVKQVGESARESRN